MNTEAAQIDQIYCAYCGQYTNQPFVIDDKYLSCKFCANKKHRRDLWDAFETAAEIIIELHDPNWQQPNSQFEQRLIRLSERYYPELITVLRVNDDEQIIRVGRARDRFGVTSYDDLVRRIRRPWREACYGGR